MSDKTAVVLLQMGGPDSLEAVKPFLYNLFCDRDIIKIGPALLQPLLAKLIVSRRSGKVVDYYRRIGGRSPLRELTEQQAAALETSLGCGYRCFVAMRYWHPFTEEALAAIRREGINRIVALSLYPHYSRATSGSSFNALEAASKAAGNPLPVSYVRQFYDHPLYIEALTATIREGLAQFEGPGAVELVFSAHGLPQSFIDSGDPYLDHIQTTVRLVMERLGDVSHHLAFQSRAGPVKWLEPSTEETIARLGGSGCRKMLMVPISFVSDHIETLYEIDIQYREEAAAAGIRQFRRTASLNSTPAFIRCLDHLVRNAG